MNTIEMLKELVDNGGMFHYGDPISIYLKRDERGVICWFEKDTDMCVSSLKLNSDNMATEWKPYVKPVDWSKVQIDTKVLCRCSISTWHKRYYAGFRDGKPTVFEDGCDSWSVAHENDVEVWEQIKLADATE